MPFSGLSFFSRAPEVFSDTAQNTPLWPDYFVTSDPVHVQPDAVSYERMLRLTDVTEAAASSFTLTSSMVPDAIAGGPPLPWGGVQRNWFQYHPETQWYLDTIRHTLTCFHSEPRRDLSTPSSAHVSTTSAAWSISLDGTSTNSSAL